MNKPNIILIGGGGHCKSCIDVIEQENKFTIAGIIDVKEKIGKTILNYPIIGSDSDLAQIAQQYDFFLITLGQIKTPNIRIKLYQQLKKLDKKLPTIISPFAYVSKHSSIGGGTIVMHNTVVNAASKIGENCIINSKSLIEHDVTIQDNCHISTQATINGNCTVNSNTFIGSGAIINQGVTVADNCTIGSGALILENIVKENSTWVGNPVKMLLK